MSNQRRLNTVHDFSALRLHPDGSRVIAPSAQSTRRGNYTVRDARGQWIAKDASGTGRISRKPYLNPLNNGPSDSDDSSQDSTRERSSKRRRRARHTPKDTRARKRQRFEGSLDFAHEAEPTVLSSHVNQDGEKSQTNGYIEVSLPPPPSSELLKAIHHYTASFYAQRGQLTNVSRSNRRERKQHRLRRLEHATAKATETQSKQESKANRQKSNEGDEIQNNSSDSSDDTDDTHTDVDGDTKYDTSANKRIRARRRGLEDYSGSQRDMYKAFDGSALMAIAMLLESHVKRLVQPSIPPDWVDPNEVQLRGGKRKRVKHQGIELEREASEPQKDEESNASTESEEA